MADVAAYDEQDQSEVFDEDKTELEEQVYGGRENGETLEELPEVLDVTRALGDADDEDDDSEIGEDLDDDEIVDRASDEDDDSADDGAPDERDDEADGRYAASGHGADEVELEYVGDLNDLANASSAAQGMESETLSDSDLRELDYKDEFTVDED